MRALRNLLLLSLCWITATAPVLAAFPSDLWVHPRGEGFDPNVHYRGPDGELYYKAENDLRGALGAVRMREGQSPSVEIGLGPELRERAAATSGSLVPVLLYDSDGDGKVDKTLRGRIENARAVFDSPALDGLDLRTRYWQIGVRYDAGSVGDPTLDRRYLASVDSRSAKIAWRDDAEPALPTVAAAPTPEEEPAPIPGLIIRKLKTGSNLDFSAFSANPGRFIEQFDTLTREADGDAWTVDEDGSVVLTHLDEEDFFFVQTTPGLALGVEWGDVPFDQFFSDYLAVAPDTDGCLSSLDTRLVRPDGKPVVVPNRLLYCPADNVAVFDAPDGYEIELAALQGGALYEGASVGNSIRDNLILYGREVNPRSPASRATGTIGGNVKAGFRDAGADLADAGRHLVTGTYPDNIHTGAADYVPSPLTAVPFALWRVIQLDPVGSLRAIGDGAASAVRVVSDVTSATVNGVINPVVQVGVGGVASPEAADTTAGALGVFTQAVAKNLPFGERSIDAVNPITFVRHDRAFAPAEYTRTDTQLNIDRLFTVLDASAIRAIDIHNRDSSDDVIGRAGEGPTDNPIPDPAGGVRPPNLPPPVPAPAPAPIPTPTVICR